MLELTADGKSAEDIALIIGISARTVNFHLGRMFEVFDVYSKTHLVAEAFRRGILDVPSRQEVA